MNTHRQQFQERLQRIAAGGPNTMGQLYCGLPEEIEAPHRRRKNRGGATAASEAASRPRSGAGGGALSRIVSGFLIGATAVLVVRYARFRLTGSALAGPDADLLLATDVVLAMTLAIMLRGVVRLRGRIHGVAKFMGVATMALAMHNLVFLAPGAFSRTFSPEWVDEVLSTTQEFSLLGTTLVIAQAPHVAPARVIR